MAETTPETREPLRLKLRLLESVSSLLERNNAPMMQAAAVSPDMADSGVFIPVARADERFGDDPSAIELTYDAPGCPITFPAGRQMQVSFEGPVIDEVSLIYPMETLTWEQMQEQVAQTADLFERAGWPTRDKPRFGPAQQVRRSVTLEEMNKKTYGTKRVTIGVWSPCDAPHVEAYAEVRHLNSSPSGASIPPAAVSSPRDPDAPDRFVLRVKFWIDNAELTGEIKALRDARRVEAGDVNTMLDAKIWLDDPDWRPEGWDGVWIK